MVQAIEILIAESEGSGGTGGGVAEIHHVCYSFAIDDDDEKTETTENENQKTDKNVFTVDRSSKQYNLTFQDAFEEAKRIFNEMLPGEQFLQPSAFNNDEDDDEVVDDDVLQEMASSLV